MWVLAWSIASHVPAHHPVILHELCYAQLVWFEVEKPELQYAADDGKNAFEAP